MAIINRPKITKESPTELMHLIHSCKQHIYTLNKLGYSYSDASAMICSLMLSKVPASIQRQWKMTLLNKGLPEYTQFLNFLERLARSFRSTTTVTQTRGSWDQSNLVRQRAPRGHAFTESQATPTCQPTPTKNHMPFEDVMTSKPNPFESAFER